MALWHYGIDDKPATQIFNINRKKIITYLTSHHIFYNPTISQSHMSNNPTINMSNNPITNMAFILAYNLICANSHWSIDAAKNYCLREYSQFNMTSEIFSDALKTYIDSPAIN